MFLILLSTTEESWFDHIILTPKTFSKQNFLIDASETSFFQLGYKTGWCYKNYINVTCGYQLGITYRGNEYFRFKVIFHLKPTTHCFSIFYKVVVFESVIITFCVWRVDFPWGLFKCGRPTDQTCKLSWFSVLVKEYRYCDIHVLTTFKRQKLNLFILIYKSNNRLFSMILDTLKAHKK